MEHEITLHLDKKMAADVKRWLDQWQNHVPYNKGAYPEWDNADIARIGNSCEQVSRMIEKHLN